MSHDPAPGGYKMILVPVDQIAGLSDSLPHMATVTAESSVCNCDNFWSGPFEVVADVGSDRMITMSRVFFEENVEVVDPP